MSTIILNLPDALAEELSRAGRESSRSPEAVAQDMIRRMIALRKFERLRREVREALGPDAPATEEEILSQIS